MSEPDESDGSGTYSIQDRGRDADEVKPCPVCKEIRENKHNKIKGMKNKAINLIAILAIASGGTQEASAFSGSDGTADNPYMISSIYDWGELVSLSSSQTGTSGKYFKLATDLSGVTSGLGTFWGHLDGDGYTITLVDVEHGFINNATGGTIENLEVKGTLKTSYVFGGNIGPTLSNCVVNLTTSSSDTPAIVQRSGNFTLNNSIMMFQGIAWFNLDGVTSGRVQAYEATFDPDIKPDRTGGTEICNGKGTVYADGFKTGGIETFTSGSVITISLPGVVINDFTSTGVTATKTDDSTVSFTMPNKAVSLSITRKSVTYMHNVSGEQTTEDFTILNDDGTTDYPGGTYVVCGNVTLKHGISFGGTSTIIVTDGSRLSFKNTESIPIEKAINATGNLYIRGQQGRTGRIDTDMTYMPHGMVNYINYVYCIYATGDIIVNDCVLDFSYAYVIGIWSMGGLNVKGISSEGKVTIDNAIFSAFNGEMGANDKVSDAPIHAGQDITITGSQVKAKNKSSGYSIVSGPENKVYVSWRRGTDTIEIGNQESIVNITGNKYFYNGTNLITGLINNNSLVNNKTLVPAIDLWDGGSNTSRIDPIDGQTLTVMLDDRTLYKDGHWNTLSLPFNLTDDEIGRSPLADGTIMELDTEGTYDGHSTGLDGNVLYLYFKEANAIVAGKPYIISWTEGSNLVEPVFRDVTLSKAGPMPVTFSGGQFVGNYDEIRVGEGDEWRYIYLGAGSILGYSSVGKTLGNFRAHFEMSDASPVKGCQMGFGEDGTTGIVRIITNADDLGSAAAAYRGIYTLDGQRLDAMPTRKGIYIKDGRKVVVGD